MLTIKRLQQYYFICLYSLTTLFTNYITGTSQNDLTVIGSIDFNGGIPRQSIGLIDCLKEKVKINFYPIGKYNLSGISDDIKEIISKPFDELANVVIFEEFLHKFDYKLIALTKDSKIKIAYSMFEADRIPNEWVNILNNYFDAVVVPDNFFISVYQNSGVKIPVFEVPLGIYIDDFLNLNKSKKNKPFVFGCTCRFFERKNHKTLIEAFDKEFCKNKAVKLVLNGGGRANKIVYKNLLSQINKLNNKNIKITNEPLSWKEYVDLFSRFDCYVNISSGEGFSITPREAIAAGIPAIITRNTAQITICDTGYLRSVESTIRKPAYFNNLGKTIGNCFDCNEDAVRKALRDVYDNYEFYLKNVKKGRDWVQQYRWQNLQNKYLNLVKPNKLIFGKFNQITDEYLMTNSYNLYEKYQVLLTQTKAKDENQI